MAKQGGKINAGSSSRGQGQGLKKGQWSNAEDQVLMEYVQFHGEGSWSSVPKKSGLKRCGKSCRLRWANHLRPDLKKFPISSQEEQKIVELHADNGNKWACIAAHLEGRTDNEIKNFWNTRAKKRKRAGLPLYPLYIQQRQGPNSLSSLLQNPNSSHSQPTIFNSFTFTSPNAPPYSSGNSHFNLMGNTNGGGIALSLSSSSNQPFSASSSISPVPPYYHQALPLTSFNMNGLASTMGASFNGFTYSQTELPSIQFPFDQAITQASSSTITNQSEYLFPTSRTDVDNYGIAPQLYSRGNVGFLGDVLRDSQALRISEKGKGTDILDWGQMEEDHNTVDFEEIFKVTDRNLSSENNLEGSSRGISSFEKGKGKEILDCELMEDPTAVDVESIFMAADGNTSHVNNLEGPSTGHSSVEIDDFVERNLMTADDISSLLDNF